VIRTIWLGFIFLIILAGAGSFRFAFGHFDAANASGIVHSEIDRALSTKTIQDTLTKAERLPVVAYVPPVPDAAELAKAAYTAAELLPRTPAVVEPAVVDRQTIVDRQPQEAAPPVVRQTRIQKPKRKQPKPDTVVSKALPAVDLKACQLEEFDAFRWAFSLPTGCHT
jgi:hypothetical protein